MSDLNAAEKQLDNVRDDLVTRAGRFGMFGWIAFFITLFFLVVQNLVYAFKPPVVMGAENGQVVGRVVFDEPLLRSMDEIKGDLKKWVARCVSVNRHTIYEDLSICLTHMQEDMADKKLAEYEKINYAPYVETVGCEKSNTNFYENESTFQRDKTRRWVDASISGEVICNDTDDKNSQEFKVNLTALITYKTLVRTLGIEVTEFTDVE